MEVVKCEISYKHITFTSTVFKVCAFIFQYAYMLLQGHVSNPKIALKLNLLSVSTSFFFGTVVSTDRSTSFY